LFNSNMFLIDSINIIFLVQKLHFVVEGKNL
jgi:hypothetical protein